MLLTAVAAAQDDGVLGKRYVNHELGFQLAYPGLYKMEKRASHQPGRQRLANFCADVQGSRSCIRIVYLEKQPFDLEVIRRCCSPTGMEDHQPEPQHVGAYTFYYYGPGGGGVAYPDGYYFDLHGRTLIISFDGPYVHDKTPPNEMKLLERKILNTFRVLNK